MDVGGLGVALLAFTMNDSPADHRIKLEVEHVLGDLANVTVRSVVYTEYLHLARTSDGWKIVNDVWQLTPVRLADLPGTGRREGT